MCIFQVLTVRGPRDRAARGLPRRVWGFRATRKPPGYAPAGRFGTDGAAVNPWIEMVWCLALGGGRGGHSPPLDQISPPLGDS